MTLLLALLLTAATVLAANADDGTLYGIRNVMSAAGTELLTLDPKTGVQQPVGPVLPKELIAQNLAAIDTEFSRYYLVALNETSGESNLIGLSLTTGKIETRVPLPFASSAFVGVGETVDVDPSNGEVFVVGLMMDKLHHIYRVNPRTGATQHLANIGDISVLGGIHTFDMGNDLLWIQYGVNASGSIGIDLFAFNARTGKLVHRVPESEVDMVSTLRYDIHSSMLYGLGFEPSSRTRTVVEFDPDTRKTRLVGKVDGYLIENGGITCIDPYGRRLYAFLQKAGGNASAPFDLVGMSLTTGEVMSHVTACTAGAYCPWSLEFMPTV